MKVPIYHIDAFAERLFSGNPAAVCPLQAWLPDATLQAIAAENNLSETAFIIGGEGHYQLRWFTPLTEVDLCGHATLAAAHAVFTELVPGCAAVAFATRSGELRVTRQGDLLNMDFPALPVIERIDMATITQALGAPPQEVWRAAMGPLAVYATEAEIRALIPDMEALKRLGAMAVIATARGDHCDFVSRVFAPKVGIPEDPVTGAAHCTSAPYWAAQLGKTPLHARQLSIRGGELWCDVQGARVTLTGRAVTYLTGAIFIGD